MSRNRQMHFAALWLTNKLLLCTERRFPFRAVPFGSQQRGPRLTQSHRLAVIGSLCFDPCTKRRQGRVIGLSFGINHVVGTVTPVFVARHRNQQAAFQLILDQQARDERDAHTVYGGFGCHREELETRAGQRTFDRHTTGLEPVAPRVWTRADLQQPERLPVAFPFEPDRCCNQPGTAHRDQVLVHQEAALRPRPDCLTGVEGCIQRGFVEQEGARAHAQVDGDVGMERGEPRQARQQPFRRKRRHHPKLQRPALATLGHQFQRIPFDVVQSGGHFSAVGKSSFGQGHATSAATEQLHAHEVLECTDLAADGALGHRQFLSRFGKALVSGGGFEGGQRERGRNFAAHGLAVFSWSEVRFSHK
jgi:hypothetical protein